jgi:hypothetical protein
MFARRLVAPCGLIVLLSACGGGKGINVQKVEQCAQALVPYDQARKASGRGMNPAEIKACDSLSENEKSEAVLRMYKLEGDSATPGN